jgi:hypothetical protein
MKFRVTMKDPDTLHDAIRKAVKAELRKFDEEFEETEYAHTPEESAALLERRCEKHAGQCGRWFKYGEYLTVEIDTDAGTCVVVEDKP